VNRGRETRRKKWGRRKEIKEGKKKEVKRKRKIRMGVRKRAG
jgi:hypothetical protein